MHGRSCVPAPVGFCGGAGWVEKRANNRSAEEGGVMEGIMLVVCTETGTTSERERNLYKAKVKQR